MLITKLTVVNACLASMGEAPANSLNDSNQLIASALEAMTTTSPSEQSFGWYFNLEQIQIHPTTEGYYYVPNDVLGLSINHHSGSITIRGRRLYDRSIGAALQGTKALSVVIIRHLDFEDLPFHAQRLIQAATVLYFQKSYDGDEMKIVDAQEEYFKARTQLMAEHIRSTQANMLFQGPTAATIHNNRYHNGYLPHRG